MAREVETRLFFFFCSNGQTITSPSAQRHCIEQIKQEIDIELESKVVEKLKTFFTEHGLSKLAQAGILHVLLSKPKATHHLRSWILNKMNHRIPRPENEWQRGCPEIIPGLRASAWWDPSELSFTQQLQDNFDVIRAELVSLRGQSVFQPYRAPTWASSAIASDGIGGVSHDAGEWNVYYLFLHNAKFEENCSRCPKTVQILESIPGNYKHAFFSALAPHSHVVQHNGPTNKKLRCHLPLIVSNSDRSLCRLRVGHEIRGLEERKCILFDDSFQHEAWNDSDFVRIVLIIDIWHPDLSSQEVRIFDIMQRGKMEMERSLSEKHLSEQKKSKLDSVDENESFFALLERTKKLCRPEQEWWQEKGQAFN